MEAPDERAAAGGRRRWFRALAVSPWLLLGAMLVWIAVDIVRLNRIEHAEIRERLERYYARKQGIEIPYPKAYRWLSPTHRNIFLFGASSVVLSDGATFHYFLEQRLIREVNPELRLLNFGYCGVDSFTIERTVRELLERQDKPAPDLLVFYMGHNEYANAYHHVISKAYDAFEPLLAVPWLLSDVEDFEPYLRLQTPRILKALQEGSLVDIEGRDYGCYDALILEQFARKLDAILELARARDIPVVMLSPVGNLRAEPFGALERVSRVWEQGLAEPDYGESIRLLEQARDAEILTFDVRAKSPLIAHLRALAADGRIVLLDLDQDWKRERLAFGPEQFMDYFHLREPVHRRIADQIFELLTSHPRLRPRILPRAAAAETPLVPAPR
ncbi:MAG: hypothetical protein JXR96_04365 [Deltaproteobacteria bacterium]|nr:hypothetical protein [Deltaproteobacteria bacterium]